ncbi:Ankyrin repeat protein 1 [Giardia muris]|uniref:Ankyrin repeat protein 1 n=1 Tax=Giardia muris TaxID=5742 RepID=A0A4Z1T2N9_GIAMU|nr:Ankyrin repeat protein 1 [Giardia muris]|eukprot:TNJ28213.1 Ankyrin repeat protein 1 [Giardia muris]
MGTLAQWFEIVRTGDLGLVLSYADQFKGSYDASGNTALILAALSGNAMLARTLAPYEGGIASKRGQTALQIAVAANNAILVDILAPYEKDVTTSGGMTPLMAAAKQGSVDILTVLLPHCTNARDDRGNSALEYAILYGQNNCAKFLIDCQDLMETDLRYALEVAQRSGNVECIDLLKSSLSRMSQDSCLSCRIMRTLLNRQKHIITWLRMQLDWARPANSILSSNLSMTTFDGPMPAPTQPLYQNLISQLVQQPVLQPLQIPPPGRSISMSHDTQRYQEPTSLNTYSESPIPPSIDLPRHPVPIPSTPLPPRRISRAPSLSQHAQNKFSTKQKFCLGDEVNKTADPNNEDEVPSALSHLPSTQLDITSSLPQPSQPLDLDTIKLEPEEGAPTQPPYETLTPNQDTRPQNKQHDNGIPPKEGHNALNNSDLMLAIHAHDVPRIDHYLKDQQGRRNEEGQTALMTAVICDDLESVQKLVGVEAGLADNIGITALMIAASRNNVQIVRLLSKKEARMTSITGKTALMSAAEANADKAVHLLSSFESRMQDENGMTALMYAAAADSLESLKILYYVERDLRTSDGSGPRQVAEFTNAKKVLAYLQEIETPKQTDHPSPREESSGPVLRKRGPILEKRVPNRSGSASTSRIIEEYRIIDQHITPEAVKRQPMRKGANEPPERQLHAADFNEGDEGSGEDDEVPRRYEAVPPPVRQVEGTMPHVQSSMLSPDASDSEVYRKERSSGKDGRPDSAIGFVTPKTELYRRPGPPNDNGSEPHSQSRAALENLRPRSASSGRLRRRNSASGTNSKTELMACVEVDDLAHARSLCESQARQVDQYGNCALMYAARLGKIDFVRLLAPYEQDIVNSFGQRALDIAMEKGNTEVVALLQRPPPSQAPSPPHQVERPITSELKSHPGEKATSLIHAVVNHDIQGLYKHLEQQCTQTDEKGMTGLMYAAELDWRDAAAMLFPLEGGLRVPTYPLHQFYELDGGTALMIAASRNHYEIAKTLSSVEGRLTDNQGISALMIAARYGFAETVEVLVDIEGGMRDNNGLTALMLAIQNNSGTSHERVTELLIKKEAKMTDDTGMTALMWAAMSNQTGLAQKLLGEATMVTNSSYMCGSGFTALMAAAQAGALNMVKLLYPLEGHITQPDGKTAISWATRPEVIGFLRNQASRNV